MSDVPTRSLFEGPVAFVDVETSGGTIRDHHIIELAVVAATGGALDFEWSTLIDPGWSIPPGVQRCTGITDEMVRRAPSFAQIADELLERLAGRVFIAHNVAFDYRFVRAELARTGHGWLSERACTVRLSRRLYPSMPRHTLDYLIARHGLVCERRHRALSDARVLWQFWNVLRAEQQAEHVEQALAAIVRTKPRRPLRRVIRFEADQSAA